MSFMFQARLPRYGAKICGIKTPADYDHCVSVGAAFIGCVFFEKSPRHLSWEKASRLAEIANPNGPVRVALTVNATDAYIEQIMHHFVPDMIQLHGDETPERSAEIKSRFNVAVMKAFRVKSEEDIKLSTHYHNAVDWLLFDADWPHTKQSKNYISMCSKIVSVGRVKWFGNMTGKDNCAWYLFDEENDKPTEFYGRK